MAAASDIEKSLTVQQEGQQVEEWLELANGCKPSLYLLPPSSLSGISS